ncbi:MAG: hypothetical protein N2B03_07430, partial [Boseongicola sp.]
EVAFERAGLLVEGGVRHVRVAELAILHATGKRAGQKAINRCADVDTVVVNVRVPRKPGCNIYDSARLARTGALALYPTGDGVKIITARQRQGARLWAQ